MSEAIEISIMSKAPDDLLAIPEDYEIVKGNWNDIRKGLSQVLTKVSKVKKK